MLSDNSKATIHHGKLMIIAIVVLSAILYLIFDVHAETASSPILTVSTVPTKSGIGITVDDNSVNGGIAFKETDTNGQATFLIFANTVYTVTIMPTLQEFSITTGTGDYNLSVNLVYKEFLPTIKQ